MSNYDKVKPRYFDIAEREALNWQSPYVRFDQASGYNPASESGLLNHPSEQPAVNTPLPRPYTATVYPQPNEQHSVVVDQRTHRIRYEAETESSVVIVVEPKG